MQKQRRVERVEAIKNILIKNGIIEKPSPRKKKESRGRKVVSSPKRHAKSFVMKQVKTGLDHPSPLITAATIHRIDVPDFPFRYVECLDDWTDGFLGRGSEKVKKVFLNVNTRLIFRILLLLNMRIGLLIVQMFKVIGFLEVWRRKLWILLIIMRKMQFFGMVGN